MLRTANLGDTSTLNEGKQELKGESLGALPCQHPCPNCPGGLLERQCQGVVTAVRVTLVKCADMPLTSPSPHHQNAARICTDSGFVSMGHPESAATCAALLMTSGFCDSFPFGLSFRGSGGRGG